MDFSALGQAATESDDLTQNKSFERAMPRAGVALLRLRDYIETGRHEGKNASYKPALKTMLVFELLHPEHAQEFDGKKEPMILTVRMNKGATTKSGYKKLFNVMNTACGGNKQHFVEMIGQPFLGEIYHNSVGEGENKKTYANLDLDGAWSLKAPVQTDAIMNTSTPIPVPELHGTPKAFLWENETVSDAQITEMWESIFIEGEREVEDKATKEKKMVSKNWIQETIMKNIEWEGSVTQALTQEHISLDGDEPVAEGAVADENAAAESELSSLPAL